MERLTDFFKACSDETRIRLLMLLSVQDFCVCELVVLLGLPQPKISKHLRRLKEFGLVKTKREDNYVLYSLVIEDEALKRMLAIVDENLEEYAILKEDRARIKDRRLLREEYHKTIRS